MSGLPSQLVDLLQFLLPGFLSAWIFYGFTSFLKPSQFERVVQALIFTLIIQTIVSVIQKLALYIGKFHSFGFWTDQSALLNSVVVATILGFLFSYLANRDLFHRLIRKLRISKETSYPSEWYGEFSKRNTYVVLHLEGERRIMGWPYEWPSSPEKGHFALMNPTWLADEANDANIPLSSVESILIPASDVSMVEFLKKGSDKEVSEQKINEISNWILVKNFINRF